MVLGGGGGGGGGKLMALSVGFRFVSLRTATSYRLYYDCFLEKIMEQKAERES